MDAETLDLTQVFQQDIRYAVPLFQRPYVWKQDEHWAPLWDDIRVVAERVLAERERADEGDVDSGQFEQEVPPHFLGAIVVDQVPKPVGEIDTRLVIDGQQRLTTLQLLLDACRDLAEERKCGKHSRLLSRLLRNDEDLVGPSEERFKVWPTNADRDAFSAVMERHGEIPGKSRIIEANSYFRSAISEWLDESTDPEKQSIRVEALTSVLRKHLKLVVISLGAKDNAQVIFESLNARGTPLLASDLVKNMVFQRLQAQGADVEAAYETYWKSFEKDYWRTEVGRGNNRRYRLDLYFYNWLKMQMERELVVHQIFPQFRHFFGLPDTDIAATLADMSQHADVYAELDAAFNGESLRFPRGTIEGEIFYRFGELDPGAAMPLFLWLYGPDGEALPDGERTTILQMVESFLMRRMLARYGTKSYSRMFLDVLRGAKVDPSGARQFIFETLNSAEADSNRWPDDEEVDAAVRGNPLYRQLSQGRTRVVLEAIEHELRSSKTENITIDSKLTIEHVMPVSWQAHWPLPCGEDADGATTRRDQRIHTLGNLTLVTSSLNPALSNAAWQSKRTALREHSLLVLNLSLCDEHEVWDEAAIADRAVEMSELVLRLWPGPDSASWQD